MNSEMSNEVCLEAKLPEILEQNSKSLNETDICFVCQDESSIENEFAPENICACKGSNRIHKSCFNLLKDKQVCCICKTAYTINPNAYRKRTDTKEFVEEIWVNGSKAEYFIDKNHKKQGQLKVYFNDGKEWMTEEYKDDKLNGTRKIFSPNHKVCRIQKFTNGQLIDDSGNFDVS
jgi:hypothetical protein